MPENCKPTDKCWIEQKPPQQEGYTPEGFPIEAQDILQESEVFPHIGLVGNILRPINQDGVKPGEVRVIYMDRIDLPKT